jgi:hypothetical protein
MCAADSFPDVVFAFISVCQHITINHEVWIGLEGTESFKRAGALNHGTRSRTLLSPTAQKAVKFILVAAASTH